MWYKTEKNKGQLPKCCYFRPAAHPLYKTRNRLSICCVKFIFHLVKDHNMLWYSKNTLLFATDGHVTDKGRKKGAVMRQGLVIRA